MTSAFRCILSTASVSIRDFPLPCGPWTNATVSKMKQYQEARLENMKLHHILGTSERYLCNATSASCLSCHTFCEWADSASSCFDVRENPSNALAWSHLYKVNSTWSLLDLVIKSQQNVQPLKFNQSFIFHSTIIMRIGSKIWRRRTWNTRISSEST